MAMPLGSWGEVTVTRQRRDESGQWRSLTGAGKAERYRARCYVRGWDGVRREVEATARKRADAEAALLTKVQRTLSAGDQQVSESTPLVRAGVLWLEQATRPESRLSTRSVSDYTRSFYRCVDAEGSSVRGLTLGQANDPQRLRVFLQAVADERGTGAAKMARSVLANVLAFAVDNGALTTNAIRQVRPVKARVARVCERDRTRAMTVDERDALLDYADKLALDESLNPRTRRKRQAVADLVALLAYTGVRIEEARSLRWEHVDLDAATLDVHGTKTAGSRRRLSIASTLLDRLRARHADTGGQGLVIASPSSQTDPERPWEQSNSASAVRAVLDGAGLTWAVPHTFRRTVATLLDERGATLRQIADWLGHADPGMTARVYLGRDFQGDKSALAALL